MLLLYAITESCQQFESIDPVPDVQYARNAYSEAWVQNVGMEPLTESEQCCPWVGLTHGLGRDFSVFGGLGWFGSKIAKVLKFEEENMLMHFKHG